MQPHRRQPTRLRHPWDSPGKNTGVSCHFLLQCMKMKSESEVTQSCPTLRDPMDCCSPGSSVHGIFQARVLEWGASAFSGKDSHNSLKAIVFSVTIYYCERICINTSQGKRCRGQSPGLIQAQGFTCPLPVELWTVLLSPTAVQVLPNREAQLSFGVQRFCRGSVT